MRHAHAALLAALVLAFATPATAQTVVEAGEADCSTPRRALLTWLANLQEGEEHPQQATRCFDWGAVRIYESDRQHHVASRFKHVLDARGLYVQMDEIPDEEDPEDTTQVVPFPNNLPDFYLVRKGSQWLISAETIRKVPTWYDETFAFDIDTLLEDAPSWLSDKVLGIAWWQLIGLLLAVGLALLIRYAVSWVVQNQGTKALTRLVQALDGRLLKRAARPIGTVVMMLLLMWVVPVLRFGVDVNRVLIFALRVGAAVAGVVIVYRLVDVGSDVMAKRADETETKLDDQLVPLVRKSVKVITVVLGVIFVLQNMEVDVASLIAGVSLGGLAFTLAARDTVSNLFGSLSIFADQPFQVGDWVVMQGVEGMVEEVGMRSTRVRTFYRSLVSIPNSKVADGVIDNYGMRDARRTFLKLGVQYDTTPEQMEAFCEGIRGILAANPKVKKDSYHVYFTGFGDSALEVMLYFFFQVDSWTDELINRHNIYLDVLRLAKELGVSFAFPTRTLHMATQAKEKELPPPKRPARDEMEAAVLAFGPGGKLGLPEGSPIVTHGFQPGFDGSVPKTGPGDDPDADIADSRE
ncbi:MAG TPA: mechanosensitive ion channel family protein [Sandaracinaceae bacterium LLY-WYZ-13_1]|nr:mechanosensitive ion channel family protein [Sandaracinaceae bacterium LLY-WYZ-13_1]